MTGPRGHPFPLIVYMMESVSRMRAWRYYITDSLVYDFGSHNLSGGRKLPSYLFWGADKEVFWTTTLWVGFGALNRCSASLRSCRSCSSERSSSAMLTGCWRYIRLEVCTCKAFKILKFSVGLGIYSTWTLRHIRFSVFPRSWLGCLTFQVFKVSVWWLQIQKSVRNKSELRGKENVAKSIITA